MKLRSLYLWAIAFLLVVAAAIYQRMTGPTYPLRISAQIGAEKTGFRLPRSFGGAGDAEVRLAMPDTAVDGTIEYRRFRSNDEWTARPLERQGSDLVGYLPHQPPAGKMMYRIHLQVGGNSVPLTAEPVILRFKGDVPPLIILPHIICMFLAMLFSTRAGLEALAKRSDLARLTLWTVITLGVGGLLLGPVVQKYAFGAFWTGWPLGQDLTDNKTIVAFLFWAIALWRLRRNPKAGGWVILAAVVLFAVYMIPHSVLGSELDYTKAAPANG